MHQTAFPVEKMCKIFKVSKSGYYKWLHTKPSKRWQENEAMLIDIQEIFEKSHHTYGSPRIREELIRKGHNTSRPRIARIMRTAKIFAQRPRSFKVTTDSSHSFPIAPNVLDRAFKVDAPGKVWVSDITYIKTSQGWVYLTVIIDLFDRKVIGWSLSNDLTAKNTSIAAWKMAIINRPISGELIFHSDRGVQYACTDFVQLLKNSDNKVIQSMSRKGNCWDNAVAESFFKTLKTECVYKHKYQFKTQAELSVFEYIETWYNKKRRHSTLNYKTIQEFEIFMLNQKIAA